MRPAFSFLAVLFIASASFAADDPFRPVDRDELTLKSIPFAPEASAVVLDWRTEQDDDKHFETEYFRVKVLNEQGRHYANVEIPFDEKQHDVRDVRGRTIEPDGTTVSFDGKVFQKTIVKGRGVSLAAKTFTLPDVRAGSILEYAFRVTWSSDVYVPARWLVQREIPILHQHHTLRAYRMLDPNWVTISLAPGVQPVKTSAHVWEFDVPNIPPVEDEPYALPATAHTAAVAFFYQFEFKTIGDYWANAAESISSELEGFIGDSKFVRQAVPAIVAGATTDEEKLRRIYTRVQQIENLSDEDKSAEQLKREKKLPNRWAEDVLRDGYGTAMEVDLLFVALARAAGIDCDPALVANHRVPFSRDLPSIQQLSSMVVAATFDGSDHYYDPAYSMLPYGMLHYDNVGADGLRLRKKGGGLWIRTSIPPATLGDARRVASLHFDGESIAGSLHLELNGYQGFQRRVRQLQGDEPARRKALEDEVKGYFPAGSTVKLTKVSSWTSSAEPLTADFDVSLPNVVSTAGSHMIVPLSFLELATKNSFTSETRRYDVHFDYPRRVEDTITLALPAGWTVSKLPEKSTIAEGPLSFQTASNVEGASITFHRVLTIETSRIPVAAYPRLRTFVANVAAADAAPAVLERSK